ncbi:ubiquitin-like small modifier protein 1 [Nakamurella sp. GG22]
MSAAGQPASTAPPVTVRVPTILRAYTGGASTVTVDAGTGCSVGDLITRLESEHPGIRARVLDEAGQIRRFVNVYVDDEDVRFGDGLQTDVAPGTTLSIIPAVAGG